jgi:uncharacterized protein YndB with AHSA1/START domain
MVGTGGFTCPEVTLEAKVGGAYRIAMQPPVGELFHLAGKYLVVQPPTRLVYTFRWEPPDPDDRETVARLTLHARYGATEVAVSQGPFASVARLELHKAGWTDTLVRLASHLAPARPQRRTARRFVNPVLWRRRRPHNTCSGRSSPPPASLFEGGSRLLFNDGGPQHSAGAQLLTPSLYREPLPSPVCRPS